MSDPTTAGSTEPAPSAEPVIVDEVTTRLTELGVDTETIAKIKDDLGVATLNDLASLAEKDLLEVGMKVVPARKLVQAFVPAPTAVDSAALGAAAFDVLPGVPDDVSWLEALKAGGVLKVDQSTVISVIRAALASRVGLFEVPDKLVKAMETFADTNDEQVDPEFFRLRKQLTRRTYGDIFEAIDGLDGSYVTEGRKKELFTRVDKHMWPAILGFNRQLHSWQEAWMQGVANPGVLMMSITSAGTAGGVALPPGVMQAPDTGVLRDHADAVNDAINRVFAGTGVQIAAALAYEASQIRKSLENPRLPSLIGAANRDQMLRQLGVAVNATQPRLEVNLTRFVLATMQAKDQPAGNEELQYFGALYMLGSQIPWDQLGVGGSEISGIGGRTRL